MRIITWNVYRNNRQFDTLCDMLLTQQPDVVCLQEVLPEWMPRLESLGMHVSWCREYARPPRGIESRLVMLSRTEPAAHQVCEHNACSSIRSRLMGAQEGLEFQYLDFVINGKKIRIFNVHLPLNVPPRHRLNELEAVTEQFAHDAANIICGDMNTFSRPLLSPFTGPIRSYKPVDYLLNERRRFNRIMKRNGLYNPHRGVRTQAQLPFQLDVILMPLNTPVTHAERPKDRCGSDHWPLLVDFDPATAGTHEGLHLPPKRRRKKTAPQKAVKKAVKKGVRKVVQATRSGRAAKKASKGTSAPGAFSA